MSPKKDGEKTNRMRVLKRLFVRLPGPRVQIRTTVEKFRLRREESPAGKATKKKKKKAGAAGNVGHQPKKKTSLGQKRGVDAVRRRKNLCKAKIRAQTKELSLAQARENASDPRKKGKDG